MPLLTLLLCQTPSSRRHTSRKTEQTRTASVICYVKCTGVGRLTHRQSNVLYYLSRT